MAQQGLDKAFQVKSGNSVVRASDAQLGGSDSPFGTETLLTTGPQTDRAKMTVQDLYRQNRAALDQSPDDLFPSFGTGTFVYSRDLMGEAFRFVSGVEMTVLPEKVTAQGKIGEQEAARVWVQRWDFEAHDWRTAILASFTDAYLVGQLRGASADHLIDSGLWTIGRNPRFATAGGDAPRMLKRFVWGEDSPINEVRYQAVKAARKGAIPAVQTHVDTSDLFGGRVPTDYTGKNGKPAQRANSEKIAREESEKLAQKREIARVTALANEDAGNPPWFRGEIGGTQVTHYVDGTSEYKVPEEEEEEFTDPGPATVKRGRGRPKGSKNTR